MRRYWLILIIFFSPLTSDSFSQPYRKRYDQVRNTIDITYGGSGLYLSGNYSRKFLIQKHFFLSTSIGTGTIFGLGGITLPHQCTFNFGRGYNFFETGVGGTFWTQMGEGAVGRFSYNVSPIVGYRREMVNDFVFRIYINPLIRLAGEYFYSGLSVIPFGGISLGYSF